MAPEGGVEGFAAYYEGVGVGVERREEVCVMWWDAGGIGEEGDDGRGTGDEEDYGVGDLHEEGVQRRGEGGTGVGTGT